MWNIGKVQIASWKDHFYSEYSELGVKVNMSWKGKFAIDRKCKICLTLVT